MSVEFEQGLAELRDSTAPSLVIEAKAPVQAMSDKVFGLLGKTQEAFGGKIEREVIEQGDKIVLVYKWEEREAGKQITLSIREGSLSFIGREGQYRRLEKEETDVPETVETALLQTLANPIPLLGRQG